MSPIARRTPTAVHPTAISLVGLVIGLGAAAAAADARFTTALVLWLLNRALDGFDGTLARTQDRHSELGAYVDIVADFIVYAAVPLGIAVGRGGRDTWIAVAVLLASFYVNTISWAYLAAFMERRGASSGATSVVMPVGLIEGAETVVLFALMLAMPQWASAVMWVMAALVAITIAQRVTAAVRRL